MKRIIETLLKSTAIFLFGVLALAPAARASISVGASGSGTLTFGTLPAPTEWATLNLGGTPTDINTAADLDSMAQALAATSVITTLGSSGTWPPSANDLARRNTGANNGGTTMLQTRPNSTKAVVLMATLQNTSGSGINGLTISYDFFTPITANTEEVPGVRAYYSLTGLAGSWTVIPALSTATAGALTTDVALSSTWADGATMYLLWADDNAVGTDNAYTLANVSFAPTVLRLTLDSPANNAALSHSSSIIASATVKGPIPATAPYTVTFYTNVGAGPFASAGAVTSSSPPYQVSLGLLPDGTYGIYATVTDTAAASATSATNTFTTANLPPAVAITSPANNAGLLLGVPISILATASDIEGSVTNVELSADGTLLASFTTAPYSYTWTGAGVGPHTIMAVAYDNTGLSSTSTVTVTSARITVNVNVDRVIRTGLAGPVGSAGSMWNQTALFTVNGLLDSFGAPTPVGFSSGLVNGSDDWVFAGEFIMLEQGFYNFNGAAAGNLVINNLPADRRYDLYIASYYPNENGSIGYFSTTNLTDTVGDQYNNNGGFHGNATNWVRGVNYVLFENVLPDPTTHKITINIVSTNDFPPGGTTLFQYRAMVNGFQLVDLTGTTTAPAAPTNLTASVAFSQVSLSWAAMATSTGYNVKRSTTSGSGYTVIGTTSATTTFLDTNVVNGIPYYYVVSATNFVGESANSTQISATPNLGAPIGVTAGAGDTLVRLGWTAPLGAQGYNVKRSLTSGGPYTTIANLSTTTYTNTGLINNTPYYYVVSSTNNSGPESPNSAQVSATPVSPTNTTLGEWYFYNSVDPTTLGWAPARNFAPTPDGFQLGTPGVQEGMMSITRPAGMSFDNCGLEMAFIGTGDPGNATPYAYLGLISDSGNPPRYCYGIKGANTTAAGQLAQNINVVGSGLGEQVTTTTLATNWLGYHTMALVRQDDNTCLAYCDGVFVGSRATTPPLLALQSLGVGMNYFGADHYFPRGTVVGRVRAFKFPSGGFNPNQLWTPDTINAEKRITSFLFAGSLPGYGTGVVNEASHTVNVILPHNTPINAVVPEVTFLGTSMNPPPFSVVDFSSGPVTYTVTASNLTTQAYIVSVTNPASTNKIMSNVFFTGLGTAWPAGSSGGTNLLALYVTNGTPVTALAPTYDVSLFASGSPSTGTTRDFTTPQIYTITAEDGSQAYYSVAVVQVTGYFGYEAIVKATGPVSYWPLNEASGTNAADIMGANPATYSGTVTLGAPGLRTGAAMAVQFAGGTATAPYSDSLNPATFTVEFWALPGNLSAAYVVCLQDRTTGRMGYAIQKNNFTSGWDFTLGASTAGYNTVSSGSPVELGTVYYVAATYDGTTARVYVNGVLGGSLDTVYVPATPGAVDFTIGSRNGNTAINGIMQDVAFYNRALTPQEIQSHYQNAPSNLQIGQSGGKAVLTWVPGGGGLQAAPVVTGPYTNVPAATSPWTNAPSAGNQFWRLKF